MHKFDIKDLDKLDSLERRQDMPPYETLEKFGLSDQGVFLDIGCGIGYFTIPAAEILKHGKVIGIDIMEEMLQYVRERAGSLTNIEFKKSDEYSFPIEDSSVDYAMLSNVLHEVEDKVKYLKEIKRVLRNNSSLYLIEWDKESKIGNYGPPLEHRLSRANVKDLCIKLNLRVEKELSISENHFGMIIKMS